MTAVCNGETAVKDEVQRCVNRVASGNWVACGYRHTKVKKKQMLLAEVFAEHEVQRRV